MALCVHLYYKGKDGAAQAFAREMEETGTAAKIRAKEGNLRYNYYQPLNDPDVVLLIDMWADQEALDDHHESPEMQTILELREKYDLHMEVERLQTEDAPIPDFDQSFILE